MASKRSSLRVKGALSLRVVTWNIHKGIGGVDRRYRPERIVDVLRACGADVVLLQEVDEGVRRSRRDRQVDLVGDALELPHRAFFPNHTLKEGHYGNAVLSRYPLDHAENLDLTLPMKKKRGSLHVRLTVTDGRRRARIWIHNVHLGLAEFERKRQLLRILDWQERHRVPDHTTVLIGGDLNDVWGSLGPQVLEPAGYRGIVSRPLTFPAVRPVRALDAMFVAGPAKITRAGTWEKAPARDASDHLPLVVSLRVR